MIYLDCHDLETTLASIAAAVGTRVDRLAQALRDYDESRYESALEEPFTQMPREVLEQFGVAVDNIHFEGTCYFHGTRVLDPQGFRIYGIRPLNQVLEQIWVMLYDLVREERSKAQWAQFRATVEAGGCGHFSQLYRQKTSERPHLGPLGELVREIFFNPKAIGVHDYLSCPEIVQDIATCYRDVYGVDLERRFVDATSPCIVKFRSAEVRGGAIRAAVWYAFAKLRSNNLSRHSLSAFDGNGVGVPPDAIVDVGVVTRS